MPSDLIPVAGPIILAVASFVVGFFLGTMIERRSMNKHLEAAPMQLNQRSERLATALEASAKWESASAKWQSASESWQTASTLYKETTESLEEVIRLKDVELEAKDRTIAALEQKIEMYPGPN
jgi:sensor c-di-GMP phosphodiesterase-like protein